MINTKKPYYIATKSRTRTYGYTVHDIHGLTTYFTGPGCTAGWYKKKYDAQHRADVLNTAIARRQQATDALQTALKDVIDES